MDKKSIVNDLYQAAVISIFAGKKTLKMTPASIQKFDLEDMGKLAVIVTQSDNERVSHQTENSIRTHQNLKWLILQC